MLTDKEDRQEYRETGRRKQEGERQKKEDGRKMQDAVTPGSGNGKAAFGQRQTSYNLKYIAT